MTSRSCRRTQFLLSVFLLIRQRPRLARRRRRKPPPLVALNRANNVKSLSDIAAGYDFVMIDRTAKLEDMIAASISITGFVFIPVTSGPYDLWAASDLVEFIKAH